MPESISVAAGEIQAVDKAASIVCKGGVIAVPTDTIYGIAGLAQDKAVVDRIYEIKRRDAGKPLAICLADVKDLHTWCNVTVTSELLNELLPGPVTLVFERKPVLNPSLNPSVSRIGIRIPHNDFIRQLVASVGSPLALTSANFSSEPSTLCIEEFQSLWPLLDAIVDGGRLHDTPLSRLGSTVVDLSIAGHYAIVRNGSAYDDTVRILKSNGLLECSNETVPLASSKGKA